MMEQVLRSLIQISDAELKAFGTRCEARSVARGAIVSQPGVVAQEIYFIVKGLLRVLVTDPNGVEHTVHFALENQFVADYTSFILQKPATYALQALEDMELVVLPRETIDWGYNSLAEGQKLGRLIAEYYFVYQDNRICNQYARTPKQRYDTITDVFPNIHNRVPQHMIASYLGITPVHLSRLKKASLMEAVKWNRA